jgi:uncharacterized protein YcfL
MPLRIAWLCLLVIAALVLVGCKQDRQVTPVGTAIPKDTQVNVANTEVIVGANRLQPG